MAPTMNRALARHRAEQARMMRATGATWQEVADRLGFRHRNSAIQAVQRLTDRTPPETVEQARRKHDDALRMVQQKVFGRFAAAVSANDDDAIAMFAKELRSTVAERAKLGGAYAPQRAEVDVRVEHSATAILERAEADLLALAAGHVRHPAALPTIDAEVVQ